LELRAGNCDYVEKRNKGKEKRRKEREEILNKEARNAHGNEREIEVKEIIMMKSK
jgi:hypothetical protein